MGGCGLHIIHGACKAGQEATDWKLAKILHAFHSFFKQSPARRNDFLLLNELHERKGKGKGTNYFFPLKYCGHRWLENGKAVSWLVEIIYLIRQCIDSLYKLL